MKGSSPIRDAVAPLFLIACLLLGGSTRAAVPNIMLQLGGVAIIAWALIAAPRAQAGAPGRSLVSLILAIIAVVFLELIPLPPSLWTTLPGREGVARGFALLGQPLPWLPLSLSPYDTMRSTLWLIPPFAMLAAILRMGAYREQWMTLALGIASFAGVLLGTLQVTSGDVINSPWYIYAITNNGNATGFFANSNHMGTLLICTIPFLIAMVETPRGRSKRLQHNAGKFAVLGGLMAVLLLGLALNGSSAGVALVIPVIAASLLLRTPLDKAWMKWNLVGVGLLGIAAIAAIFIGPLSGSFAFAGHNQSFTTRSGQFMNSIEATRDFFPFGSGSGSFPSIYPTYEDADKVDPTFVNHTHNDYIELAMETGLPGILLMIATLLWWLGRTIVIWRAPIIDHFARAATIASGAILAHSAVDFPLRTSAIAVLFAMCFGLMAGPRRRAPVQEVSDGAVSGARHLSM